MSNWGYYDLAQALQPDLATYYNAINDLQTSNNSSFSLSDNQKSTLAPMFPMPPYASATVLTPSKLLTIVLIPSRAVTFEPK